MNLPFCAYQPHILTHTHTQFALLSILQRMQMSIVYAIVWILPNEQEFEKKNAE